MSKVLSVDLTDTLMRYDNYLETYVPAGERYSTYYFRVPDAWAGETQQNRDTDVMGVMQKIYDAFNEHFRRVEPNDINYLAPLAAKSTVISAEDEAKQPWLQAESPAVWEWTPCVVVKDDGTYEKVERANF